MFVSRFSNPELRSGNYAAVRVSLGTPKWPLGYQVVGEVKYLMPFGLLGANVRKDNFERLYRQRLDAYGPEKIAAVLSRFENLGKPVVLLCYEDVRKPDDWCHRTVFAQWWFEQTGEIVDELYDPTTPKIATMPTPTSSIKTESQKRREEAAKKKAEALVRQREMDAMQIKMF
ncbi:hypothetical protein LJC33_00280 [Eubacteriales bacterium OttesenSCG-928-N13]|nr:hypothetical protein [Eubacteriales bacterium OttesenSCG-928-N13]